jgi:hypothetical protein
MRLWLALRAFFRILFDPETGEGVRRLLLEGPGAEKAQPASEPQPAKPAPALFRPTRSDALTLLAALQREARFIDFLKEPLDGFSDAQIGAVARDVHRDCGKVVERWFALAPIAKEEEGAEITLPTGFDAGRFRLTGQVAGEPPHRGRLMHHGWEATRCETPVWSGSNESSRVVAPVEVEV